MSSIFNIFLLLFVVAFYFKGSFVDALPQPQEDDLPTVYEYFTGQGISSGLVTLPTREFLLNGKSVKFISGTIHYFRVHPTKWRDSLKKLRAAGANSVETYVPWNLHEPFQDVYDFGQGENELSEFLNLQKYLEMAQEEDLLVILRPGPYICSEWEFGGFPSWLLRDPEMRVRGSYPQYLERIKIYFDQLFAQIMNLQFTRGGPIIAIQIENEYGYFDKVDKSYIEYLVNLYKDSGEFDDMLFFTSDGAMMEGHGSIDGLLRTANFNHDPITMLNLMLGHQPDKPLFVMEFWPGWFDQWMNSWHDTGLSVQELRENLEIILGQFNSSVNFYMFHGGTNFAFMAGGGGGLGTGHNSVVTSYDYDAPLSEAGDYTEKYNVIVELAHKYAHPQLKRTVQPLQQLKEAYDSVQPQFYLDYQDILEQIPSTAKFQHLTPTTMEMLDMNQGNGQSYGYIVHRFNTSRAINGSLYRAGIVQDFATVIVDGELQFSSFNFEGEGKDRYWMNSEKEIKLEMGTSDWHTIDLIIENVARVNGGSEEDYRGQKGLPNGHIYLDEIEAEDLEVIALEFKSSWVKNLTNFKPVSASNLANLKAPIIVQSSFQVTGEPLDTFVDLSAGFHKGIVFVNGFNLGRYFKQGPQHRLYLPSGILKTGANDIKIFEQLEVGTEIQFKATPLLHN